MGTDRTPDRGAIAGTSQPRTEAQRRADASAALDTYYARIRARFDELEFGTRVRGVEVVDNGRADNTVTVRTHFDPPRAG